jgi:hypothetical protein
VAAIGQTAIKLEVVHSYLIISEVCKACEAYFKMVKNRHIGRVSSIFVRAYSARIPPLQGTNLVFLAFTRGETEQLLDCTKGSRDVEVVCAPYSSSHIAESREYAKFQRSAKFLDG